MADIKNRINNFFEKAGTYFFENRIKTLIFILILAGLAFQTFKNLKLDVTIEGFLKKNDPVLVDYSKFREDFVNDEIIVIEVEAREVFEKNFLVKFKKLHDELESEIPYLDDITSIINVRNTRGEKDELIVEDLFENFPRTDKEILSLKEKASSNPLYENLVISEDLKKTAIVLRLFSYSPKDETDFMSSFESSESMESQSEKTRLTMGESGEAVEKAIEIINKYKGKNFNIYISGTAAVDHFLVKLIPKDSQKFLYLAYLTVIILLGVVFRRFSGVFIPFIIVSLTLIFTLALFSVFNVAIKHPTQTLPSFLLAVSVCYSVHILALFYYNLDGGKSRKESIVEAMGHSGTAILLTGITTAVGFLSFSGSDDAPVSELGTFAGAGVFIAVFLTFILIPSLVSFIPEKKKHRKAVKKVPVLDILLMKIAKISTGRPVLILSLAFAVTGISVLGFRLVEFSHNTLEWIPATAVIRTDTEKIDKDLKGTVSMEIIIDTGKENGLYNPALLNKIAEAASEIENISTKKVATGKAWSLTEIVKETNKALHGNNQEFYKIPDSRELCAQELFLFSNSGSDDLEDFTDSGFSKARVSVKLPFEDAVAYHEYIKKVEALLEAEFPDVSVTATGLIMIYARVIATTIQGMKISYAIAITAVTFFMILLMGNLRLGLISMIPNLFPIVIIIGIAGYLSVPFSLFIMLIGNIIIGLAVDDTIHFMHNFKKYQDLGNTCEEAVEKTLLTAGRAMLLTSMILSGAFFIYLFASLNNLKDFGILAGLAILLALIADFFITPALLKVVYGQSMAKRERTEKLKKSFIKELQEN